MQNQNCKRSLENQNKASWNLQRRGPTKVRWNLIRTSTAEEEAEGESSKHLQEMLTAQWTADPSNPACYARDRLSYFYHRCICALHLRHRAEAHPTDGSQGCGKISDLLISCARPMRPTGEGRNHGAMLQPRGAPSGEAPCKLESCYKRSFHTAPRFPDPAMSQALPQSLSQARCPLFFFFSLYCLGR